jgi:hypothetical protein
MNNEMTTIELTDEQLERVSGGTNFSQHGVNIDVPININVSPTVNLALFSQNVRQSGANVDLQNTSWQNLR